MGGVFLFVMFVYALKTYWDPAYLTDANGKNVTIAGIGAVAVVGVVSLLAGFIFLAWQRAVAPAYFRGETLPVRSHADLVLAGQLPPAPGHIALPDSREATVIAPDLSNLPPGATAVDPVTGTVHRRDDHTQES